MRLVTFLGGNGLPAIGALTGDGSFIAVLQEGAIAMEGSASPFLTDMLAFLRGGEAAREKAEAVLAYIMGQEPPEAKLPLEGARLLAPVPCPESIRDCMGFEQHIINSIRTVGLKKFAPVDEWIERTFGRKRSIAYLVNRPWYERPIYYKSNRFTVVGTGADVAIPAYTKLFDYELEWGVFIGSQGRDIPRSQARSHIGGYTVFNDFSCRDIQMRELKGRLGPAKGKDFDTGNAMGPCLVTPDEIPDPYSLTLLARVNGEEWSRGSSSEMYWTFEDMIAYISQSETLYPGEFIGSGTCSGSQGRGCGLEMGRFLKAGDVVELEAQGIGVLRNRVVQHGGWFSMDREPLKRRPHHLLCVPFLPAELTDRGPAFNQKLELFRGILTSRPDEVVEVTEGIDDLCRACPECREDRCGSIIGDETMVRRWDRRVLDGLGLSFGEQRTAGEIWSLIREKAPIPFCRERCPWGAVCRVFAQTEVIDKS